MSSTLAKAKARTVFDRFRYFSIRRLPSGAGAGDLGKANDPAVIVEVLVDIDVRPEVRTVLADAPAILFELSGLGGHDEGVLRATGGAVVIGIKAREVLADDLRSIVALETLRITIPASHTTGREACLRRAISKSLMMRFAILF